MTISALRNSRLLPVAKFFGGLRRLARANGRIYDWLSDGAQWTTHHPPVVWIGNWADRPAAASISGYCIGLLDIGVGGSVWYSDGTNLVPYREVLLYSHVGTIAAPFSSIAVAAGPGTFANVGGTLPVGLLSAPGMRLRFEGFGRKIQGTAAATLSPTIKNSAAAQIAFGGLQTGAGANNDFRMDCVFMTGAASVGYGSGTAAPQNTAANQAASITLDNTATIDLTLIASALNAADSLALYHARWTLSR